MEHKSLKAGWIPYSEAWRLYGDKIKADKFRFIHRIPEADRELIVRVWVVKLDSFLKTADLQG